jgi:hypothetical protein
MIKTFAAALAIGLAFSPLAAFAETDASAGAMPAKPMSDKTMAPKNPMMKHHSMHKKAMTKTTMPSDTMKSGETPQKM